MLLQRITPVAPESAVGKQKELLDAVKAKVGRVPNLTKTFATSTAALEAYLGFSGSLADGFLDAKLREQIALTVAEANATEVIEAKDAPELIAKLQDPSYEAQVERAMVLHLEAFDWNCPQHITQRFTIEEVRELNAPLYEHVAKLEAEIEQLKNK